MSVETDLISQLFGRGSFWKGAVRYRLYNCWSAAEPYSVYTRDPPPLPPRSALCCCSTLARPEWPFSALIGRRAERWGASETEGNTVSVSHKRSFIVCCQVHNAIIITVSPLFCVCAYLDKDLLALIIPHFHTGLKYSCFQISFL